MTQVGFEPTIPVEPSGNSNPFSALAVKPLRPRVKHQPKSIYLVQTVINCMVLSRFYFNFLFEFVLQLKGLNPNTYKSHFLSVCVWSVCLSVCLCKLKDICNHGTYSVKTSMYNRIQPGHNLNK